jgi:hypothetical protein
MALYEVKIPIAGSITFEIEADSERDAITEAFNTDADKGEVEWDTFKQIVSGNILQAPLNKVKVSLLDDGTEE